MFLRLVHPHVVPILYAIFGSDQWLSYYKTILIGHNSDLVISYAKEWGFVINNVNTLYLKKIYSKKIEYKCFFGVFYSC